MFRSMAAVLLAACGLLSALPALAATYETGTGACPFREKSWFDAAQMDCATLVAREPGAAEAYRLPALRLKRTDAASTAAPVVFVNGGPGGRGVTEVGDWLAHPLRKRHDIILYDGRGTGDATPRPCPELAPRMLALIGGDLDAAAALETRRALIRRCIASVPPERRADFSVAVLADDLAAVARMFGHARVNLYAVSYGTRIAAAFARRHPQALERMLLDSVVPDAPYYGEIGSNFDAALERAFLLCERDAACAARHPGFREDYRAVAAAVAANPLRLPGRGDGDPDIHLDRHDFALLVQQLMYGRDYLPILPQLFAELRGGHTDAVRLLYEFTIGMRVRSINFGVYYLALLNDEPAAAADLGARGDLLFFAHDLEVLRGLARPPVASSTESRLSAAAIQVVAGSLDPVTAPAYGRQLAQASNGTPRYREISGAGHTPTLTDPALGPAVAAFFGGGEFAPDPGGEAGPVPYWTGSLHRAAWPRSLTESAFVSQSFLPLAGLAAVLLLYGGLTVWGAVRLLRRGKTAADPAPGERRILFGAHVGVACGALALLGFCLVVGRTVIGAAPALLLFGLAADGVLVAGIGMLVLLSIACSLYVVAALLRRRATGVAGVVRPTRWTLAAVCVNFCLAGLALQWLAAEAGAG